MESRTGAVPRQSAPTPTELHDGSDARVATGDNADPLDAIRRQSIDQVLQGLASSQGGIAPDDVQRRQERYGKNLIENEKKRSPIIAFLSNFTHLMAILLWVAGTIAFVAGMPELGVAVWLVNVINGVFSFWQEHRASQATEALKKMLPAYATVIRGGEQQKILAEDLVPGDIMLLAEGDKISADARVIMSADLQVNQSTLNGESTPSRKTADAVLEDGLSAAEVPNLVFAGTSVSEGNGRAVVFRIGMATEFGKIARLTQNMQAAESPLTRELNRLTKQVTIFAMCMGIVFFLLSMFVVHEPFAASFIFALGMGVSGAALATVVSQAVSCLWVISALYAKRSKIRLLPRNLRFDLGIFLRTTALGVSPFTMSFTESAIQVVLNRGMMTYGGDMYVGTMTIITSVVQLFSTPLSGYTNGVQPLMSFNYGAGNLDRVRRTFKLLLISTVTITMSYWALIELFPRLFISLFARDEALIDLTVRGLRIYAAGLGVFGLQNAIQSMFVGLGQAKISLFIAVLRKVILLIPLALVLPCFLGVTGVYVAEPIADVLSATTATCLMLYHFNRILAHREAELHHIH